MYWMSVTQSLLSRTPWFQNEYTHKCLRQCLILFESSHVLGCHDVLFDLYHSIPYSKHVGGARLRFLVLASSKPLLCRLCCLGRPAFWWCERCLLITESPKTPGHYRYLMWVLVYIPYTGLAVFSLRFLVFLCILRFRIFKVRVLNASE